MVHLTPVLSALVISLECQVLSAFWNFVMRNVRIDSCLSLSQLCEHSSINHLFCLYASDSPSVLDLCCIVISADQLSTVGQPTCKDIHTLHICIVNLSGNEYLLLWPSVIEETELLRKRASADEMSRYPANTDEGRGNTT